LKVICLGTGSPEPTLSRASSGYLVEVEDKKILIDCGGGVFGRLIEYGLLPSEITHLVFSHLHSDHMIDYPRFIHAIWDANKPFPKIYGPKPLKKINERIFGKRGMLSFDLIARTQLPASQEVWVARGGDLPRPWPSIKINEIDEHWKFVDGELGIMSCLVPHAEPFLKCLGFRFEYKDKSFVYSGDAGLCPEIEILCKDADLLIHWCYRMSDETIYPKVTEKSPSAKDIAKMAKNCGVKKLLLTHMRKHMDKEINQIKIKKELTDNFSGISGIAEDLLKIDL
jgi:ribonuclease Z